MENKNAVQKIQQRAGSLKRLIKLTNPWLAILTKKKKRKRLINKIRNEREVTTNTTDIQRIILEYYERLYATKLNNLEKMH